MAPATVPNAIAFWDARHGIAGTGLQWRGQDRHGGTVTLTGDGGRTWRVVLRTPRPVVNAGLAGPEGAWVETDRGAVLRSTDRGRTWRRGSFGKAFAPSFADARNGLAIGRRPRDYDGPTGLLATADGVARGRSGPPRVPAPCARRRMWRS
jgi:hypothetical protein